MKNNLKNNGLHLLTFHSSFRGFFFKKITHQKPFEAKVFSLKNFSLETIPALDVFWRTLYSVSRFSKLHFISFNINLSQSMLFIQTGNALASPPIMN